MENKVHAPHSPTITFPERFKELAKIVPDMVIDMQNCRQKPLIIQAMQIGYEFRVETLEGNYKQGKAGDYLMRGVEDGLYICDKAIFEKTYDCVEEEEHD